MFFDAKEYHTANKNVANILSSETATNQESKDPGASEKVEEATLENMDAAWGDESDGIEIDMGDDIGIDKSGGKDPLIDGDGDSLQSDIFVPPAAGADPLKQVLKKHPQSVGLHIASGDFPKALELLTKQLGIHSFEPLKQAFVDIHTLSSLKFQTMPHLAP